MRLQCGNGECFSFSVVRKRSVVMCVCESRYVIVIFSCCFDKASATIFVRLSIWCLQYDTTNGVLTDKKVPDVSVVS